MDAARERSAAATAAGSLGQPLPASSPALPRMFSGVGCFWVLLSSCLVAVCSFSFLSPAWIVKERGSRHLVLAAAALEDEGDEVSFGLLWHCSETLQHVYDCYTFGGLGRFSEIASSSWQVSGGGEEARLTVFEGRPAPSLGRDLGAACEIFVLWCLLQHSFLGPSKVAQGSKSVRFYLGE